MRKLGDRRATAELILADVQSTLQSGGMRRDTLTQIKEAGELAAQVGWQEGVKKSEDVLRQSSYVPGTQSIASNDS